MTMPSDGILPALQLEGRHIQGEPYESYSSLHPSIRLKRGPLTPVEEEPAVEPASETPAMTNRPTETAQKNPLGALTGADGSEPASKNATAAQDPSHTLSIRSTIASVIFADSPELWVESVRCGVD